jgi:molybdate transport system substrate-binding protein
VRRERAPSVGGASWTGALVAVLIAGCSAIPGAAEPSVRAVELSVFGAASLSDALAAVKTAYEAAVPEMRLTLATDASSTLRTQIEQGAPADVLLSADRKNPIALVDSGLADGDAVDFARNQLTIIVPVDNPAAIASPRDLGRTAIKVIAAGDDVPITKYANQAVQQLAGLAGYPADLVAAYTANVVSKEENVKAIVSKIELGEGDAAIVYRTDALASSKVAIVEIAPEANVIAAYAGVVIKGSAHPTEAHALLAWLAGPDGAAILVTFGFLPPS